MQLKKWILIVEKYLSVKNYGINIEKLEGMSFRVDHEMLLLTDHYKYLFSCLIFCLLNWKKIWKPARSEKIEDHDTYP